MSGQTKEQKMDICCFSTKHTSLRSKSKDWLAQNQNNVSEWKSISTLKLLFLGASIMKIQLSLLTLYQTDITITSLKCNLFSP